ncbi:MAG: type IV secretory system conjugative DNA transfer family protein, partial [Lachnospiraceae bacterium]|nr:type IV secretory system conjugative DNA transfer family protein [Lachnospiraceae bacterium]
MDRKKYRTKSILGKECYHNNDSWETGLNNNILVLGPSGTGKTRGLLIPNILQCNESFIVIDTKGVLREQTEETLVKNGYEIQEINFTELKNSSGYNPMSFIRYDSERGAYSEEDILTLCEIICPIENHRDVFWDNAAKNYLSVMVAYCMEELPKEEHTLKTVARLQSLMKIDPKTRISDFDKLIDALEEENPDSFAVTQYRTLQLGFEAERMNASILGIIAEKLRCVSLHNVNEMYLKEDQIDFAELGRRKSAIFVTVSDLEHSLAPLINLFIAQAFHTLLYSADKDYPEHMLPVPVRFFLDDFCNLQIPDMDQILSVIRSREIYCNLYFQTVTQLSAQYGHDRALSIIGNCDTQIVLGFQDTETARAYTDRANLPISSLMATPSDKEWLFVRG